MKKQKYIPGLLLLIGALSIIMSGIVSLVISVFTGSVYNNVDPLGIFGHIGIVNGIVAMVIGGFLLWLSRQNYSTASGRVITGVLSMVFGHLGAIAGALLIGTAGLLLCYFAGVWLIISGIKLSIHK